MRNFKVYEKIFNIELFNSIVTFVMFTTDKEKNKLLRFLEENHIWFKAKYKNNAIEKYQFKYLGELLERYEEKIGTNIEDIRAITLALAYSKELITQQMIIGNQEINFIKNIEKMAKNDIYLKAALYLYDNKKYYGMLQELKIIKYERTEDLIFVLSIFEDFNEGYEIFKEQLKELIGNNNTLSIFDNVGIYEWLIRKLYPVINKNRKKDIELFRALISIPTALIKEDAKTYNVLIANNYTKEEISFLNYVLLQYKPVPNTVRMKNSIVEEKIAVNMCKTLINSEIDYSKEIYDYIKEVIKIYWNFDIKCYGYCKIKDVLNECLSIKNPKTFIELYKTLDDNIFEFNILDNKWDIVANEIEEKEYMKLFDNYLLLNNYNKEKIETCIKKYEQLTNKTYLTSFEKYMYWRNSIFAKLVELDIIDLKKFFIKYIDIKNNDDIQEKIEIEHLKEYVAEIKNKKSFLFLKYFLQEHSIKETDQYGFNLNYLKARRGYYSEKNLDIERKILTPEENKEFFYYLNEYVYKTTPETYIEFVKTVLEDKFISNIISKDELRKIYFAIIKIDESLSKDKFLRNKYLTQQELEIEENKEKEEKKQKELQEKQKKENELTEYFRGVQKENFDKIYDFLDHYSWDAEDREIRAKLIIEYFKEHLKDHKFIEDEIIYFNKICNKLLRYKNITVQKYKNYILDYVEGSNK